MRRKLSLVIITTILLIAVSSFYVSTSPTCLGWTFLHFKVRKADGSTVTNASISNKIAFITFWNNTSETCKKELPVFNEMYEKLKDSSRFVFIAFTTEPESDIQKILAANHIKYEMFHLSAKQCN